MIAYNNHKRSRESVTKKLKNGNVVNEQIVVKKKCATQEKANVLVLNYKCAHGKPFTTKFIMEFKELVSELSKLKSEIKCMCRKNLVLKINTKYKNMIQSVTENLKQTKYVCTTINI